jgi:hypothetical protein
MMKRWRGLVALTAVGMCGMSFVGMAQASECSGSCTSYFGLNTIPAFAPEGAPATARKTFLSQLPSFENDGFSTASGTEPALFNGKATLTGKSEAPPNPNKPFNQVTSVGCAFGACTGRFNTTSTSDGAAPKWWETKTAFTLDIRSDLTFSAFGFYATDAGDFDGGLQVIFTDVNGDAIETTLTLPPPNDGLATQPNPDNPVPNGTLLFFGLIDSDRKFTKVTFNVSQRLGTDGQPVSADDYLGFDDFVFGPLAAREPPTDVPEPMSLSLVAASLAALAATRRRRPR